MIYLLIANIAMAIGYALYQVSFRNLTFFQWNRMYLLGVILLSFLIPIGVYIDLSFLNVSDEPIVTVNFTSIEGLIIYSKQDAHPLYWIDILSYIYWIGVGGACMLLLRRCLKVRQALSHDSAFTSFSFFKKIVIGTKVRGIKAIEDHERVHVEQGHSYDLILVELVAIFNWFNPIVYWIKKELKFQHECIADEICSSDKVSYAELLVSHALQTDVGLLRHEFSNQSFLKKRIMMLFKNKSNRKKKFLYLSVVPLIGIVGLSTLLFNTSKAKEIVKKVESGIAEVKVPTTNAPQGIVSNGVLVDRDEEVMHTPLKADTSKVFTQSEILPDPKGGMEKFRSWIGENYSYPQAAIDAGLKGTLIVSFIVEKDGSLSNFEITKDLMYGTGEAAIEMLQKAPKWNPGMQNGKKVRASYTLPIMLDMTPYESVEIMPEPKVGFEGFRSFISKNLIYPESMIRDKENGKAEVYFEINKEGMPTNFKIINETNEKLGTSLINAIDKYGKWYSGIINGQPVGFKFTLAVDLNVTGENQNVITVGNIKQGGFIM